ncbi:MULTISPECIES: hypothetical protein [unclassified Streptomyces]|uniref:hypothetical protein n=1 Tax=unclassified Streptomyces TaxID=2593676 RepID=UPI00380ECE1C
MPLDPDQALSRLSTRENPSDLAVVQHTIGPRLDELLLPSLSVTAQISQGFSLGAVIRRGRPDPQSDDTHKKQREHSQTTVEQTPTSRSTPHSVAFPHEPSMPVPELIGGEESKPLLTPPLPETRHPEPA